MTLTQVTSSGLEHGLINTIGNSVQDNDFKHFDEKTKADLKKQKKEDEKIVKARYVNSRGKGERYEAPYAKYPGQPITMWRLIHDHVYDLPKGLVEEINAMPSLIQRSEILDTSGKPTVKDGSGEKLHQCYPVSF